MASLSIRDAARQAGVSQSSILRAIQSGRMSAPRKDDGGYAIDPAELFRVFPPQGTGVGQRDRSDLRGVGGTVLRTSFDRTQEAALREALAAHAATEGTSPSTPRPKREPSGWTPLDPPVP